MTGAGVSADSGIPTFRGPEGYWTVGSTKYEPQDISTTFMWQRAPDEVWSWYLYRRGVCHAAAPHAGHHAVAALERWLGDRFALITQNVDGLHLRAGNTESRMCRIHGDLDSMRCTQGCCPEVLPIPFAARERTRDALLGDIEKAGLICPSCGHRTRPHVLLWDETYDEALYRADTARDAATQTDLMVIVGTTGATQLPAILLHDAAANGAMIVNIDIEPNLFSNRAVRLGGPFIQHRAEVALPALLNLFRPDAE